MRSLVSFVAALLLRALVSIYDPRCLHYALADVLMLMPYGCAWRGS